MDFICMDLTFVTLLDVFEIVIFHSQPLVTFSEVFLGHCVTICMSSEGSFIDLLDEHVFFVSIHASKQDHVVVSLVENITVEEEIGCQSSKSFLILT